MTPVGEATSDSEGDGEGNTVAASDPTGVTTNHIYPQQGATGRRAATSGLGEFHFHTLVRALIPRQYM